MINWRLALLAALVVLPAGFATARATVRIGRDHALGSDLAWAGFLAYLLVARVAWLALHPYALTYPLDAIRLTQGLTTPAGVAAAVAAVLLTARRRRLDRRVLFGPAAVGALTAMVGWHAACPLQSRCVGSGAALVVAPTLALVAAALAVLVWRRLGPHAPSVATSLAAVGVFLVAAPLANGLVPRLAAWPDPTDLLLAAEGALLLVAAWRSRSAVRDAEGRSPRQ